MLRGTGGRRKRGQQRMRWLDGITESMDVGEGKEGEREMYGESNMEIYNTICKIDR